MIIFCKDNKKKDAATDVLQFFIKNQLLDDDFLDFSVAVGDDFQEVYAAELAHVKLNIAFAIAA